MTEPEKKSWEAFLVSLDNLPISAKNWILTAKLLVALLKILLERKRPVGVRELAGEINMRVHFNPWELEPARTSPRPRWMIKLHFIGTDCRHAGLLTKSRGVWNLTPTGSRVARLEPDKIPSFVQILSKHQQSMQLIKELLHNLDRPRNGGVDNAMDDLPASPSTELTAGEESGIWQTFTKLPGRMPSRTGLLACEPVAMANHSVVTVYFATDRKLESETNFTSDRDDKIHYGKCQVSIPRNHHIGELECPSILRFEIHQDADKHIILQNIAHQDEVAFYAEVSARTLHSYPPSAFVFVHGFNVSFNDAARRTAQICFDLGFQGAPVFYSWPSKGNVLGYFADARTVEWSQKHLKHFLMDFAMKSGAKNIFIIAHSMGTDLLSRTLRSISIETPPLEKKFTEIILAAPDIDAEIFKRDIAPVIFNLSDNSTLYESRKDLALSISALIHDSPVVGADDNIGTLLPNMEVIDASDVDTSFFNHSNVVESPFLLGDLFHLIVNRLRADRRFALEPVTIETGGRYWKFKV